MPHVDDKTLYDDAGKPLGTFSSHRAGIAAMIRLTSPDFRSPRPDKAADLEVERRSHEARKGRGR